MPVDARYQIWVDGDADNPLTTAVASITVTESIRELSTFNMTLAVDIDGDEIEFLDDPRLKPGGDKPITILVEIEGETHILFHGIITKRDVQLVHGGPGSSITISGADHRALMDRNKVRNDKHGKKVNDIVLGILSRSDYPFNPGDINVENTGLQLFDDDDGEYIQATMSDLDVVRQLAGMVGVEFWLEWELRGKRVHDIVRFESQPSRNEGPTVGGFSPPFPLAGLTAGAKLTLNTGDSNNTLLQFTTNRSNEVPINSGSVGAENQRDGRQETTTVPEATQEPLGQPLPINAQNQARVVTAGGIAVANAVNAAALNDALWTVTGTATTSAEALCGTLVRPRQVVTVEGAGARDSGDYLVWSVTHDINPADHQLTMELKRNAEGSG